MPAQQLVSIGNLQPKGWYIIRDYSLISTLMEENRQNDASTYLAPIAQVEAVLGIAISHAAEFPQMVHPLQQLDRSTGFSACWYPGALVYIPLLIAGATP